MRCGRPPPTRCMRTTGCTPSAKCWPRPPAASSWRCWASSCASRTSATAAAGWAQVRGGKRGGGVPAALPGAASSSGGRPMGCCATAHHHAALSQSPADGTDRLVDLVQAEQDAAVARGEAPALFGAKITGGGCGGTVGILAVAGARGEAAVQRVVQVGGSSCRGAAEGGCCAAVLAAPGCSRMPNCGCQPLPARRPMRGRQGTRPRCSVAPPAAQRPLATCGCSLAEERHDLPATCDGDSLAALAFLQIQLRTVIQVHASALAGGQTS